MERRSMVIDGDRCEGSLRNEQIVTEVSNDDGWEGQTGRFWTRTAVAIDQERWTNKLLV
jgi:hypothetical protein